jgi:hypothetical protein
MPTALREDFFAIFRGSDMCHEHAEAEVMIADMPILDVPHLRPGTPVNSVLDAPTYGSRLLVVDLVGRCLGILDPSSLRST